MAAGIKRVRSPTDNTPETTRRVRPRETSPNQSGDNQERLEGETVENQEEENPRSEQDSDSQGECSSDLFGGDVTDTSQDQEKSTPRENTGDTESTSETEYSSSEGENGKNLSNEAEPLTPSAEPEEKQKARRKPQRMDCENCQLARMKKHSAPIHCIPSKSWLGCGRCEAKQIECSFTQDFQPSQDFDEPSPQFPNDPVDFDGSERAPEDTDYGTDDDYEDDSNSPEDPNNESKQESKGSVCEGEEEKDDEDTLNEIHGRSEPTNPHLIERVGLDDDESDEHTEDNDAYYISGSDEDSYN